MDTTLHHGLEQMRGEDLMKVAKLLGIQKGLTRKLEVIQWLATYIDIHLPEVVKQCSEMERQALAEAAFGEGILDPEAFWGKYGVSILSISLHPPLACKVHSRGLISSIDRREPRC